LENKKLRILFSHYGIKKGDGWGRSFFLARGLAELGHSVTFLTSQYGEFKFPFRKEIIDKVLVISFPDIVPKSFRKGGIGILNIILKIFYVLFKKYDIVHSDSGHRPSSGLPCVVNRFFHKSKYVSEWWDYFGKGGVYDEMPWWYKLTLGNYDTWAEKHNKKIADGVIALSHFTKERAKKLGIDEQKILILQGGSDVKGIKFYPNTKLRDKYNLPLDYLTFGYIGMNDDELEYIEPFLLAINDLKREYKINWFTTGKKLSNNKKLKYNLGEELKEFGWVNYEIFSEVISCADIFLLLQKDNLINYARWPQKFGDYLAAGRPLLANKIGEIKYLCEKYNITFIFVEYKTESIKEKIIEIYYNKDRLIGSYVYYRNLAEDYFDWSIQSKKLEKFYYKIL